MMLNRRTALLAGIVVAVCMVAAVAGASSPADIYNGGELGEGVSQSNAPAQKPLSRGVTYTASTFPIAMRVRPPDALWGGVQLHSGRFGFVVFVHLRTGSVPLHGVGYITLESAKGSTRSAATVINRLRATPHTKAGPIKPIRVGGFPGYQFDATVVGSDLDTSKTCPGGRKCPAAVSFAPFLTNHHCGWCGEMKFDPQVTLDVKTVLKGQLLRIIALDVRGKPVVIYLESTYALQPKYPPTQTYPTFLPYAKKMLATLRFPAS